MYLSEVLKTRWADQVRAEVLQNPLWTQKWASLKAVMLNTLGAPLDRQSAALEKLKRCKQQSGQSPAELLDYMRPLWEELGSATSPLAQVLEFTAALRREVNDDVTREKAEDRMTLPQVEVLAERSWRRHGLDRTTKDPAPKEKPQRTRAASQELVGDAKPPNSAKKARLGRFAAKKAKKPEADADKSRLTCYNCGKPGHPFYKCKEPRKAKDASKKDTAEKDKGRRD
jgi:hypothetical protein